MSIQKDAVWAKANDLSLTIDGTKLHISGSIPFRAHYNGTSLLLGNDIPIIVAPKKIIEDSWSIKLTHDYSGNFKPPEVYETTARIKRTSAKRKISLLDMHLNAGGEMPPESFCVAIKFDLEKQYAF